MNEDSYLYKYIEAKETIDKLNEEIKSIKKTNDIKTNSEHNKWLNDEDLMDIDWSEFE